MITLTKNSPLVESFFSHCEALKGQFISVVYRKTLKLKKDFRDVKLETISNMVVRCGVDYNNQKVVKEGHADGSIDPKKYVSPIKRVDGSTVRYVNEKNGDSYLGVTPSKIKSQRSKEYILDGKEVSYEEVEHMLYASDKRGSNKEPALWLTLRVENITEFPSLNK
jgi:hypothetical protein